MNDKLKYSIEKIYKLGVSNNNNNYFFNKGTFDFIIFMIFLFIILYWYLHNQISYAKTDWEDYKCDPKYMYLSGYIKPEGTMTSSETTYHNYKQCISRGYKQYINELKNNMNYEDKNRRNNITFEKNIYDVVFKEKKKNNKLNDETINEINEKIQNYSKTNLTKGSMFSYNYLKNIGVYLDQFDLLLNYINTYVKNYLTYKHLELKGNTTSLEKAGNVKNLLDKYFDGPSF